MSLHLISHISTSISADEMVKNHKLLLLVKKSWYLPLSINISKKKKKVKRFVKNNLLIKKKKLILDSLRHVPRLKKKDALVDTEKKINKLRFCKILKPSSPNL